MRLVRKIQMIVEPSGLAVERQTQRIDEMFDDYGAGKSLIFVADFINFGYWANVDYSGPISSEQRAESERDLYRLVLNGLEAEPDHRVLEVGCAAGMGAALARTEFGVKDIHGLDASGARIALAKRVFPEIAFESISAKIGRLLSYNCRCLKYRFLSHGVDSQSDGESPPASSLDLMRASGSPSGGPGTGSHRR
jgi:SAM-dependent methyltransferase